MEKLQLSNAHKIRADGLHCWAAGLAMAPVPALFLVVVSSLFNIFMNIEFTNIIPDRTEQNRTEQDRREQKRTKQNRTEQNKTEQNRIFVS